MSSPFGAAIIGGRALHDGHDCGQGGALWPLASGERRTKHSHLEGRSSMEHRNPSREEDQLDGPSVDGSTK
jgi:hypothetical protein